MFCKGCGKELIFPEEIDRESCIICEIYGDPY